LNSRYIQDTIGTLLDDWDQDLSDDEKKALEFLKSRLYQQYPGEDLGGLARKFLRRKDTNLRITDLMELIDIVTDV